jgi:hypothetical protein
LISSPAVGQDAAVTNTHEYESGSEFEASGGPGLVLQPVAGFCAAGDCPTVYRSNRGTLVVQGYALSTHDAGVTVPSGEMLVEIPPDLLAVAAQNLFR